MSPAHDASRDLLLARRWLGLAVAVLLLAGLLAVLLVLGRTPPFDRLVGDPDWFRRCLVVHVVLSLVLWFQSFVATLLLSLPAHPRRGAIALASPPLAVAGLGLVTVSAWLPGSTPVMSNYVPVIDHPLFGAGLLAFACAVLCVAVSRQLVPARSERNAFRMPGVAAPFLRGAIVTLLLAGLTLVATRARMTPGLAPAAHYELLFWGLGHVLQLASVLGMTAVWCWCATVVTGSPPFSRRLASALAAVTVWPWLAAPILPLFGTWTPTYHEGFTRLMQFALLPAPLVVACLCARAMWRQRSVAPRAGSAPMLRIGFAVSLLLTLLGLVLGTLIRAANTMVPAHYHASIGAVTAAFMVASVALLPRLGLRDAAVHTPRAVRWQPLLYGIGQSVFAIGFACAGAPRKAYGAEQAGRDLTQTIGLAVMGIGGLVAVLGGITFLVIFVRTAWCRQPASFPASTPGRVTVHGSSARSRSRDPFMVTMSRATGAEAGRQLLDEVEVPAITTPERLPGRAIARPTPVSFS